MTSEFKNKLLAHYGPDGGLLNPKANNVRCLNQPQIDFLFPPFVSGKVAGTAYAALPCDAVSGCLITRSHVGTTNQCYCVWGSSGAALQCQCPLTGPAKGECWGRTKPLTL